MAHILLIDEHHFSREFVQHELIQMGHKVSYINDRDSLFIFLEDHTPDLIILDPNLNGFMGWDLLREIKRPGRPRMPTLLFTSFQATLLDSQSSLADGCVIKNVDTGELIDKMAEMLPASASTGSSGVKWPSSETPPASDVSGSPRFEEQGDEIHGRP